MGNVAAIDCGTNTIKLLVGDLARDPDGVRRESRMVRLGQGVDATGRLAPEALERAFAAIDEYAAIIASAGVEQIRFCATSATRDAENADEFRAGVSRTARHRARGAGRRGGGAAGVRRRGARAGRRARRIR